jgi:hypothetical protein
VAPTYDRPVVALVIVVIVVVLCLLGLLAMRGLPSRPGRGGFEDIPGPSRWGGPWDGGGGA